MPGSPSGSGRRAAEVARAAQVPTGPARGERIDAIVEALLAASPVVVTMHANADGDAAGSAVAMAAFLAEHGADARIASPTPFSGSFSFLLPDPEMVLPAKSEEEAAWCRRAGLAVVVDTSDPRRIGRINSMIRGLPTVVVDHHPPGDRFIDGLALVDTGAAAAGELVFELIERAGGPWTEAIVRALYVAVLTDTGGFRFQNTTPDCLRTAARLVELGAEPEALYRAVYSRFRPRRFELLQEALATLTVHPGGRVAWMTVPKEAFDRVGATVDDLEGFVDVPRDVEGVEVAILFRTTSDGRIKVSLRALAPARVHGIARALGGGGHPQAAAVVVSGKLERVVERVVEMVVAELPAVRG